MHDDALDGERHGSSPDVTSTNIGAADAADANEEAGGDEEGDDLDDTDDFDD